MTINIKEIEEITSILFSKLKEKYGNNIEIQNDYFWDIVNEELYNPYEEPKTITLGQLSQDYELIKRILNSDDAVAFDLKWLSNILKVISIENKSSF